MDLDLSFDSPSGGQAETALEINSSLSYKCSLASGDLELFLFIPETAGIKTWPKQDIFSDFSTRISLPSISPEEANFANVLYELSLLQRILDEMRIQILKKLPVFEIKNKIYNHARHVAALLEEYFRTTTAQSEVETVTDIARKILRQEDALQVSGIKELDQYLSAIMVSHGDTKASRDFSRKQQDIAVDIFNKNPSIRFSSRIMNKIIRRFSPDRIRILNERNKEFGVFEDWFRVTDSRKLPYPIVQKAQRLENYDVLHFKRKFLLKSYLKTDYPCGIKEVLRFNLRKIVRPEISEIYAYANITLAEQQKTFFRRQEVEFTAKFFKIKLNQGRIESIQQLD